MTRAQDVLDLGSLFAAGLLVGVRVSGVMVFAPFLGGSAIPMQVKASLTLALTVLLTPSQGGLAWNASSVDLMKVVVGELVVGLALGMTLTFVSEAVQLAGQILGVQMGFSLVNILDPQTQVDTPVLAIFHQLVTVMVFLQMNVHHWLLRGLARSFSYLPPGTAGGSLESATLLLRSAGGIFLAGLQVAAPALAATLIADVTLGFIGKASPNLPVLFLGLSVKSVLGMFVMIATIAAWPAMLEKRFTTAIELGEKLLYLAR